MNTLIHPTKFTATHTHTMHIDTSIEKVLVFAFFFVPSVLSFRSKLIMITVIIITDPNVFIPIQAQRVSSTTDVEREQASESIDAL